MGYIDDYLLNLQNRTQSRGMNPSVSTGEPSRTNQAITSSTLPSNVNAIGSYQALQEKQDPKLDIISGQQEQARSANAQQQQTFASYTQPEEPLMHQIGSYGKQAYDLYGEGKQLYDLGSGLLPSSTIGGRIGDAYTAAQQTLPETVSKGGTLTGSVAENLGIGAEGQAIKTAYGIAQEGLADTVAGGGTLTGAISSNLAGSSMSTAGLSASSAVGGGTLGSVLGTAVTGLSYAPYVAAAKMTGMATKYGMAPYAKEHIGIGSENFPEATGEIASHAEQGFIEPLQNEFNQRAGIELDKYTDFSRRLMDSALNPAGAIVGVIEDVFGTVVCTQLYNQKRISKEAYKADAKFGKMMDKSEYLWYLSWGTKVARRMAFSQLYSSIIAFFFVPISKYMAWEMGVGNGSLRGRIFFKTLQLLHKVVGRK